MEDELVLFNLHANYISMVIGWTQAYWSNEEGPLYIWNE